MFRQSTETGFRDKGTGDLYARIPEATVGAPQ